MPSKRKRRHANAPDVEADVEASSAAGLSFDETVRLAAQEEATRRINEQDAERVAMGQEQEQSEEPVEQPTDSRSSVRAPLPDDVSNGDMVGRATRASKRPAPPPPTAGEWAKARAEYGVFENQRNPGRPAMFSAGIVQRSGVREAELRAEGVMRRWREAEARQESARRTRARTTAEA